MAVREAGAKASITPVSGTSLRELERRLREEGRRIPLICSFASDFDYSAASMLRVNLVVQSDKKLSHDEFVALLREAVNRYSVKNVLGEKVVAQVCEIYRDRLEEEPLMLVQERGEWKVERFLEGEIVPSVRLRRFDFMYSAALRNDAIQRIKRAHPGGQLVLVHNHPMPFDPEALLPSENDLASFKRFRQKDGINDFIIFGIIAGRKRMVWYSLPEFASRCLSQSLSAKLKDAISGEIRSLNEDRLVVKYFDASVIGVAMPDGYADWAIGVGGRIASRSNGSAIVEFWSREAEEVEV